MAEHASEASGGVDAGGSGQGLEAFVYDDKIVRMFGWATIIWGIVAFLVGVIIAIMMAFPDAGLGIEYLSFGRLRPLHTNAAIFAFAGNAIFAAVYYSTQRLCKARMWSDLLSGSTSGAGSSSSSAPPSPPARDHAGQGVRRARVAHRSRDRRGLGRLLRRSTSS